MDLFKSAFLLFSLLLFSRSSFQESELEHSYELSMISRVNQTGHYKMAFELVHTSKGLRRNWHAKIQHKVYTDGGIEKHYVTGNLSVPPPKPNDYELFPGIGFYKFHPEALKFHDGMLICAREGGHLMIVNSHAEAEALKTMYARHPDVWRWANIGFYDLNEDGNYTTIFGKSLNSTGYNVWHPDEPDHSYGPAFCGVINRDALLGGGVCKGERPFICEFDLSWDN